MTINKRAGRSIKKNIAFYIISIILTMLTSMVSEDGQVVDFR